MFSLKSSLVNIFFFLKRLTKPKLEIFFDYNDNESCKEGHKQNFGKSWHYWVNSVALSKENKKRCFYTVFGTCQKTFVTGCMGVCNKSLLEFAAKGHFQFQNPKLYENQLWKLENRNNHYSLVFYNFTSNLNSHSNVDFFLQMMKTFMIILTYFHGFA